MAKPTSHRELFTSRSSQAEDDLLRAPEYLVSSFPHTLTLDVDTSLHHSQTQRPVTPRVSPTYCMWASVANSSASGGMINTTVSYRLPCDMPRA